MRRIGLCLWLAGCGSTPAHHGNGDAGPDGDGGGFEPVAPALPEMTCPKGWREVPDPDVEGLVTCDPWPNDGPTDCTDDEAHFPGEAACRRIGTACPAGDYAEDIPAESTVLYVQGGAPAGGDGSVGSPFGTIADGLAAAPDGSVIALSKGTFDESVTLADPVTIWGACVAQTIVAPSTPAGTTPAIALVGRGGSTVKNLQVSGARLGIDANGNVEESHLSSVLVRGTLASGITALGGGSVEAQDVVVRDTQAYTGLYGVGVNVVDGGRVTLARVVLERNRTDGVVVFGAGSELVASDLAVRDTLPQETDGDHGAGIEVMEGAHATLERIAIDGNRDVGIGAYDGAQVVATDVSVRGTEGAQLSGLYGSGLVARGGAVVTLTRVTSSGNRTAGILVTDESTMVTATDVVVADTRAQEADGALGLGLAVQSGASAGWTRGVSVRNRTTGVLVDESSWTGNDVVVAETATRESTGDFGYGLVCSGAAQVDLVRARIESSHGIGLAAIEASSRIGAQDLLVTGTLEPDCAADGCPAIGTGIGAYEDATIAVTSFRSSDHAVAGVQLANGGAIDLHEGEVSRNPIGANVQTADFDSIRLQDGVRYVDNGVDLDTSASPLP
jgi:hypothetical protein